MQAAESLMARFPYLKYEFDPMMPEGLPGLYNNNVVYLNPNQSSVELHETVAEEIAHHYTTFGNIIDQSDPSNRKQEAKARAVGAEMTVHPSLLIACKLQGFKETWECAEYLNVTPEYLVDALQMYKSRFGLEFEYSGFLFKFGEADSFDIFKLEG